MFSIGTYQTLNVKRSIQHGYVLQDTNTNNQTEMEAEEEVLLPTGLAHRELSDGENVRVFLYKDGEERVTATMQEPQITLGEVARLRVKDVNRHGAFLDWGLSKDLFVPYREQVDNLRQGDFYLFYMYLDRETNRLAATQKIDRYLDNEELTVEEEEKVDLWIWNRTDLGYNVIINNRHKGLIYHDEFFRSVRTGDRTTGYIKQIRPDNKIDVTLRPIGYDKVAPSADRILQKLEQQGGYLDLHDKSDPNVIRERLNMSKKTFKKSIGLLYRKNSIRIEDDGIYLVE